MCGSPNIDPEKEEELTELLKVLYDKWKSCSCGVGTDEDRKDAFFLSIRRRIEKGFSILAEPDRYDDEKEMEMVLVRLYRSWKDYMSDCIGQNNPVDVFIDSSKEILDAVTKGRIWR